MNPAQNRGDTNHKISLDLTQKYMTDFIPLGRKNQYTIPWKTVP